MKFPERLDSVIPSRGRTETDQLRELERRLSKLTAVVGSLSSGDTTVTTPDIIPALVNLADNTDFIFSDEVYNVGTGYTAYTDDEDVLANWYRRLQSETDSWEENASATEATNDSIRSTAHGSGARAGAVWSTSEGSVFVSAGYRLGARLFQKFASGGNYFAFRCQISRRDQTFLVDSTADINTATDRFTENAHGHAEGTRVRVVLVSGAFPDCTPALAEDTDYYLKNVTTNDFQLDDGSSSIDITAGQAGTFNIVPQLASDIKMKVSLWDNTDNRILRGSKPVLTSSKVGAHSGGTHTRDYVLEVMMSDGRKFYSDTVTFTDTQNRATNCVATGSSDSTNYVNISYDSIIGATRYTLYRRQDAGTWYLVDTITNGSTTIRDEGANGGGSWTIPTLDSDNKEYPLAEAFYDDIGELIATAEEINEASTGIRVPTTFTPNGNQFLQIEFLKSTYAASEAVDIPNLAIRIDRVGLSTTNGRWVPSSRDLTKTPTITPTPPPSTGGSGGNPPSGGGSNTCVEENTPILMWRDNGDHYWMPAKSIVRGDRLVSWDGKDLAPSTVYKTISGISRRNYVIHVADSHLVCSFSHRLIADMNDFDKGTCVKTLPDMTLCYMDGEMSVRNIDSIEIIDTTCNVRTFQLSKGKRNYIAAGFFSHNLKPLEIE